MAQEAEAPKEGQEPVKPAAPEGTTGTPDAKVTVTDETKTTFDAEYVKTLRGEAAKHRKDAVEAKAKLEEHEDAQKSEVERERSKAEKAEKARAEAAAKLLRYEVATAKAIPPKMVPLLTAATQEELEAQADLILEAGPSPNFDGGARDPAPDPKTPEQAHNDTLLSVLGVTPKQL